uniref:RRM domain-containing protein n=1 Tax=Sinocyclocheilus rhinocerous TaxID=307959 RepID=A0A673I4H5_9TELE
MTVKTTTSYGSDEGPLFVGKHMTEQVLLATFLPSGPIGFVQVCRDRRTSLSCGFGFVTFAHHHNAENTLNPLMAFKLMGKPMQEQLEFELWVCV